MMIYEMAKKPVIPAVISLFTMDLSEELFAMLTIFLSMQIEHHQKYNIVR
jgi:hypothetical protein